MVWDDEKGVEIHGLKIVVLYKMFEPLQAKGNDNFFNELKEEI